MLTIQYNGGGIYTLMFDDKTIELSREEVANIQNLDFDSYKTVQSISELHEIIEEKDRYISDLEEKINDLEYEICDLEDKISEYNLKK